MAIKSLFKAKREEVTPDQLGEIIARTVYLEAIDLLKIMKETPRDGDHTQLFRTAGPYIETLIFVLYVYWRLLSKCLDDDSPQALKAMVDCTMPLSAEYIVGKDPQKTEELVDTLKSMCTYRFREYNNIWFAMLTDHVESPDFFRIQQISRVSVQNALSLPQPLGLMEDVVPSFYLYFEEVLEQVPSQLANKFNITHKEDVERDVEMKIVQKTD